MLVGIASRSSETERQSEALTSSAIGAEGSELLALETSAVTVRELRLSHQSCATLSLPGAHGACHTLSSNPSLQVKWHTLLPLDANLLR